ncbi:MAG: carbamate kinase [Eubacteriales bacterium]|nr:carbamate kinase [Clostridiales bacterium]MDY5836540.1 carbamate kinase [Eubacteriales bacterium]
MSNTVIALGGNALGKTWQEQKQLAHKTAKAIVDLLAVTKHLVVSHGNGPQVGMIKLAFEESGKDMPLAECGAMSQGYIGYHLQNALYNELAQRQQKVTVASLVTQVQVDPKDPAFQHPSKPIGSFYSQADAQAIMAQDPEKIFKEDAGRGWRQVVASPKPIDIIEKNFIIDLIKQGHLVIASGGGGIPVVLKEGRLESVEAVIDKDFASALLADLIGADRFIVLTAVDQVAIHFGQANESWLDKVTVEEMEAYIDQGMFAPGSMLPKVQAAIQFVRGGEGREALITSLDRAADGLAGKTGTRIVAH